MKDFIKTNNISKHIILNKQYQRNNISSIELGSPSDQNLYYKQIKNYKNSLDSKSIVNKSKIAIKNKKIINILNFTDSLTKTPEKDEKKYHKYIKCNFSADQNKIINNHKLSVYIENASKKKKLSNVYKLPIIFNNDFNTLRLNTINKQISSTKREENKKQNIKQISSIDITENKKIYEIQNKINKDLNKGLDINIINFNNIYIKKELKPYKILNRISDSANHKKEVNNQKTNLQHYMKDKFYVDTEVKMNKKLKDIVFNHDHSLKNKIIEMNKIGDFWGGIVDYCNPVFSIRRFEYLKKKLNKKKIKKINNEDWMKEVQDSSRKKKQIKSEIKTMRLFTINSYLDNKHQKRLEINKDFLEKYNNSLQYYMC